MNKEEILLQKRFIELSNTAYQRDIVTFTDFLNLNELNILYSTPKHLFSSAFETYGGYGSAERQMVAFLPDALCYEFHYPVKILRIAPVHLKFAESLSHRDYLGALLHLGIERSCLGDILVEEDGCRVFVTESMAEYICSGLTRIRHTSVKAAVEDMEDFQYEPQTEIQKGTVSSVRLDSVLSVAFPLSRSKLTGLITGGKVFVNGKLVTTNACRLKENDIISVRGIGRIKYLGVLSETKKGRLYIETAKYI